METPKRTTKSLWFVAFTVALAVAALGFTLAYQDEQTRFSEMGSMVESHLIYALQLKDDMALIDWAKSLEKLPSMSAFHVLSDSKMVAEGGNKELCPTLSSEGISYHFPYRWVIHSSLRKDSTTPVTLTLVFFDLKGPPFWGFFLFFTSLGLSWFWIRQRAMDQTSLPTSESGTRLIKTLPSKSKQTISVADNESCTLVLDNDYMISQVTTSAAKALDRQSSELIGEHFLDLLPDPSVMEAIGESKETKLLKPFPSHPHLSALLRPVPEGTILVFETNKDQ